MILFINSSKTNGINYCSGMQIIDTRIIRKIKGIITKIKSDSDYFRDDKVDAIEEDAWRLLRY